MSQHIRLYVGIALAIALLLSAAPSLIRGVQNFKTFLSLQTLLNPCDGAGSPPPCHN